MVPHIVEGNGPKPCPLMVVGEAPGAEEEETGRPFVGLSGKLLDEALCNAGILRKDVFVTNAYKIRPPDNRNPTPEELASHAHLLFEEVEEAQPEVILTLGNVALGACTGILGGVTKRRGIWTTGLGLPLMPTYHPAYVLRQGGRDTYAAMEFYADIKEAVDASSR